VRQAPQKHEYDGETENLRSGPSLMRTLPSPYPGDGGRGTGGVSVPVPRPPPRSQQRKIRVDMTHRNLGLRFSLEEKRRPRSKGLQ